MSDLYHYTDPRGRRSGPFTEQELRNLAARGILEPEGRVELTALGVPWSVTEVDWLRDAFPLGNTTSGESAGGAGAFAMPPAPPDAEDAGAAGPSAEPGTGPGTRTGTGTGTGRPTPAPVTSTPPPEAGAPAPGSLAAPPDTPANSGAEPACATAELPFAFRPSATDPRAAPGTVGTATDRPLARSTYVLLAVLPALVGVFGVHNVLAGFTGRGIAQLVLSIFTLGGLAGGFAFPPTCCCFGAPMYLVLLVWVVVEAIAQTVDARGRTFA